MIVARALRAGEAPHSAAGDPSLTRRGLHVGRVDKAVVRLFMTAADRSPACAAPPQAQHRLASPMHARWPPSRPQPHDRSLLAHRNRCGASAGLAETSWLGAVRSSPLYGLRPPSCARSMTLWPCGNAHRPLPPHCAPLPPRCRRRPLSPAAGPLLCSPPRPPRPVNLGQTSRPVNQAGSAAAAWHGVGPHARQRRPAAWPPLQEAVPQRQRCGAQGESWPEAARVSACMAGCKALHSRQQIAAMRDSRCISP